MPALCFDRRRMLAMLGATAMSFQAGQTSAADNTIAFGQLYASFGVLGLTFSDKVKELSGKAVSMRGFMAPPLKAEANFFVLTEIPLSLCPFCSSDADWPDDIVVIYLDRAQTFEQANGLIEVRGRLEVGSWTDPESGFVSLLRIVEAGFHRV
ncbi:hypothetical protein C7441_101511 [Pseudaminobacter salicylatoxidans]|uniref:Secreted protein n=1 Tax=Pseudaminobacter salicylatoxidans TaxID=93369 RepID=A0A316CAE6_PSESE|nr:hypothetical protein C7441_101511 [Pseudaminobacter salicylatoxidans]